MEGVKLNYSDLIQQILEKRSRNDLPANTEIQLIFDTEHHHYQIVHLGWQGQKRIYGCIVHIDIKDGKIWIQRDGPEIGIANELVGAGVPKQDIVLGFKAPYKRPFTDFATG